MSGKNNNPSIEKLLGRKIFTLRRERGFSQEVLADKSNINASFLGCIERGQKCPTIRVLEKIRGALDVSYPELFDFSESPNLTDEERVQERFSRLLKELEEDDLLLLYDLMGVFVNRLNGSS